MLEYISKLSREVKFTVATGLMAIVATGVITVAGFKGYVGPAEEGLEPLRVELRAECNEYNFKHGTVIADMNTKRDDWLTENNYRLGCESWECQRQIDGPDEGSYIAVFNNTWRTCKQRQPKE